jgi:hypothetical protein
MPEEKCDVTGIEHIDINWVGCQNDMQYVLVIMNHKEGVTVMVRPHEAHLDVYTRTPRVLVGSGQEYREVRVSKRGMQYQLDIPKKATALMVWDRIR